MKDSYQFLRSIPNSTLINGSKGLSAAFACVGLLVIGIGYTAGQIPMFAYIARGVSEMEFYDLIERFQETKDMSALGLGGNTGFFLVLLSFVGACLFLLLYFRLLYQLPLRKLVTPWMRFRWSRALWGFVIVIAITGGLEIISYFIDPENYVWRYNPESFWALLLICLFILPIQTTTEELVLRGFLLPHLSHIFNRPWVGILLTAMLFGLMHLGNPEILEYGVGIMLVYYTVSGVFLGLMTVWDDGLEMAIGVHYGINLYSALLVSYSGAAIQTETLWLTTETNVYTAVGLTLLLAVVFLGLSAKKFNWPGFKYLIEPIFDNKYKA